MMGWLGLISAKGAQVEEAGQQLRNRKMDTCVVLNLPHVFLEAMYDDMEESRRA